MLSLDTQNIVVSLHPDTEDCSTCTGCALTSLCHGRDTAILLQVPLPPEVEAPLAGQEICVAYEPADPAMAAMVLFLPPLAGLILAGCLANFSGVSETWIVVSALAGAGAGVLSTALINRYYRLTRPAARWLYTE